MNKFGIVILNYMAWNETIECLESIIKQKWANTIKIYVVENGSPNESLVKLKEYREINNYFELVISEKNLGFAKGNNLGIKEAKKDGCDYVIISNPDIIFYKDDNFLEKIENLYKIDDKLALISPKIINETGNIATPYAYFPISFTQKLKWIFFYLTYFYKIYYFLRVYVFFDYITKKSFSKKKKKSKILPRDVLSSYVYASQGAFIILTPAFFTKFAGFFDKTFLFCEEFIIAELLYQAKLKEYFYTDICVLHKGSKTMELVNRNYKDKVKFTLKHRFESCKYYVKIFLKGLFK